VPRLARVAQASLIVVQPKVAIVTAAIEAYGMLGDALVGGFDLFRGE
jgi:hypothetical protein